MATQNTPSATQALFAQLRSGLDEYQINAVAALVAKYKEATK